MADSYRLVALKRLTAFLQGITPANGYGHDLSAAVFRGRTVFGENDPVPVVSILEAPRGDVGTFAGEENYQRSEQWNLLIQGWASDDVANPSDPLYALMDDVERRLFRIIAVLTSSGFPKYPDDYLLGKTIGGLTVLPGVVRPPMEQVSSKSFFYLPVRVGLVRDNE